ncbi:MAG: ATP-binding protein [Ruminococcaceae bacterium]|nr:ATP-binding protein [Oscillospiraceae bacterium]
MDAQFQACFQTNDPAGMTLAKPRDFDARANQFTARYLYLLGKMSVSEVRTNPVYAPIQYRYFHLKGVADQWISEDTTMNRMLSDILVGLHAVNCPFSLCVYCDGQKIDLLVGTETGYETILEGMLTGTFSSVRLEEDGQGKAKLYDNTILQMGNMYGGFIHGNPAAPEKHAALDRIINGMRGLSWFYVIHAVPLSREDTTGQQSLWLSEASSCSVLQEVSFTMGDTIDTNTHKRVYHSVQRYAELLEAYSSRCAEGLGCGQWAVTMQYGAADAGTANQLGSLIVSALWGEEALPEPVHCIRCPDTVPIPVASGVETTFESFPLGGQEAGNYRYPLLSMYLTSEELAVYASLPTKDTMGFSIRSHVAFDVSRERQGNLRLGRILKNGVPTMSEYSLAYHELNRHCLIVGLTGSGKTNTTKSILYNLRKSAEAEGKNLPVMVIEPAKKEYWELYKMGYDDLQIYTVGAVGAGSHPYCLNPFERIGRISLQTHIDNVYAAFKASFVLYSPMPFVLEKAIYAIYEDYGWDIRTDTNRYGTDLYPTIEDLYLKIPAVVTDMGYDQRMRKDLIGSLQARINSLRLGAKGNTLNVRRSFPIGTILSKNVVIELEDIGDDDVKAFIMSMLLIQLVEYRRQGEDSQLQVKHVLLIEEAHRLLKNVASGSGENADPRGAAVEFFCNLLAELRSKGQGFLIADQIPSKLAPDLVKNTNLKIVHRTVDVQDRQLMGGAMHMTEEQIGHLSSLGQGEAAVYAEGDNRPKLVKPGYAGRHVLQDLKPLSRQEVMDLTKDNCYDTAADPMSYASLTDVNPMCRRCTPYCCSTPDRMLACLPKGEIHTLLNTADLKPRTEDGKLKWNEREFRRRAVKITIDAADALQKQLREGEGTGALSSDQKNLMELPETQRDLLGRCLLIHAIKNWPEVASNPDAQQSMIRTYCRK